MTTLVLSVHCDDAIFSTGEFIARQAAGGEKVIVAAICSAVPKAFSDAWQETLNTEHEAACRLLRATPAFMGGVDGKYAPERSIVSDAEWLRTHIKVLVPQPTAVLIPMGVHHPDHEHFATAAFRAVDELGPRVAVYEDLPYRVMYPNEAYVLRQALVMRYGADMESAANGGYYQQKLDACRAYASQWGDDARRCVMAPERIVWIP